MMNNFKLFLRCGILIITMAIAPKLMAENSHWQSANQLLETVQFDKTMSDAVNAIIEMQAQANPEISQSEKDAFRTFFSKYMGGASLKEDVIKLYTETFTEEQIRQLTAFYKTDLGQMTISKIPELMQKSMEFSQTRAMEHIGELEASLEKVHKEASVVNQSFEEVTVVNQPS